MKYRRPPVKFIINLVLIFLTTYQISLINNRLAPYNRASDQTWDVLLAPSSTISSSTSRGAVSTYFLYTNDDLRNSIFHTINTYYNLQNTSVDYFEYIRDKSGVIIQPVLRMRTLEMGQQAFKLDTQYDGSLVTKWYSVNQSYTGPFSLPDTELANYLNTLYDCTLEFTVNNFDLYANTRTCYSWTVKAIYDFSTRSRVSLVTDTSTVVCPLELNKSWYQRSIAYEIILYLSIIAASGIYELLILRAIWAQIKLFLRVKKQVKKRDRAFSINKGQGGVSLTPSSGDMSWESLSFPDKIKFFNVWFFCGSLANIFNIIGSSLSIQTLVALQVDSDARLIFTGLGCMLTWINFTQFFEHWQSYYVLILTLKRGVPKVFRFLVGVAPVFLGYAFFGVAFFSDHSNYFADLDASAVTLFSLLNGDVIHDVFDDLAAHHLFVSRVYLYTFISLFIYAVLNIFIAIVEDAFFACKAFQQQFTNKKGDIVDVLTHLDLPPPDISSYNFDSPSPFFSPTSSPLKHRTEQKTDFNLTKPIITVDEHPESKMINTGKYKKKTIDILSQIHTSFSSNVLQELRDLVASDSLSFRPPHSEEFYPCDYPDCISCSIRRIFVDGLDDLSQRLREEFARLSEIQEEKLDNI